MLTVKHLCGHTQDTRVDEWAVRLVEKELRTQEQADRFVKEQVAWLSGHVCPYCYCAAQGIEPNPHPVPEEAR